MRRPTVIPSGGAPSHVRKPTVMGGSSAQAPRPTVIRPSQMPSSPPAPTPALAVSRPSVMPGVKRQRIAVTLADMQKIQMKSHERVLERALALVQGFSPDVANDSTAVTWGNDIQQKYGILMTQALDLSRSEAFEKASAHIHRLMTILGSIRLQKIFDGSGEGFLTKLLGKGAHEIDTPKELETAEREIRQITELVSKDVPQLLSLKTEFEKLSNDIKAIQDEAEAASIAALKIAEHFASEQQADRRQLSQRFTDRSMSLTATCAQIQGGGSIRQIQLEQPLQLINIVQNVVLVTVPGLIGDIAALQTLLKGATKPTVTQISELDDSIQKTLKSLKV